MKRSEEVSIILRALIESGSVSGERKEIAAKAIKAAMKEIRTIWCMERKKNKEKWRYKMKQEKRTHCPVCARKLEERWDFCVNCGTMVSDRELKGFERKEDEKTTTQ